MNGLHSSSISIILLGGLVHSLISGTALGANEQNNETGIIQLQISETAAPINWPNAIKILANSKIIITPPKVEPHIQALEYHSLFQPGDRIGLGTTGVIENIHNKPLTSSLPSDKFGLTGHGPFISMSPTASIALHQNTENRNQLLLVALYDSLKEGQDENTRILNLWEKLPGTIELIELQEGKQQPVTAVDVEKVNSQGIKGSWFPSGGTKTSWGSVLTNQGREPNAHRFENEPLELANLYLDTRGKLSNEGGANPYDYGYRVELQLSDKNKTTIERRLSMGRYSGSSVLVMPDERTVYITDDHTNGALFMFISDEARKLTSGTLYAAQWNHQNDEYLGNGVFNWIKLGHADDKSILQLIDSKIAYSNIFDHVDNKTYKASPDNYRDYKFIKSSTGQASNKEEVGYWIKLKKGMEKAAAFLESRRYAAYLGATTDFSHLRDLSFDPVNKSVFLAINQFAKNMILPTNKTSGNDQHIKFTGNAEDLQCGGIFKMDLYAALKDQFGDSINSAFVAGMATPVLVGQRNIKLTESLQSKGRCDAERIAGPENLFYNPQLNLLFISEAGSLHLNNYLWAYNTNTRSLTRILSAPIGADIKGLDEFQLNDSAYLTVNIQQPATYDSLKTFDQQLQGFIRRHADKKASVGYIGPFTIIKEKQGSPGEKVLK